MREKALILVLLLGLGTASAAIADEVHLKSGGKVVGQVVEVTADRVRVKTRFGVQTFPRADVARIEYKATPAQQFAERLKKTPARDVPALLTLARWAKANGLKKEAERVYRMVTEADPDNRVAHEALGHVRFEGLWMTKKEAEAARARREIAERRAQGLVRYRGEWVTPEEKDAREKGYIKVGDRWLPPDEANRARGLVQVGGEWVPKEEADTRVRAAALEKQFGVKLGIAATARFRVFSEINAEHARSVAEACEKALRIVRDRVGYARPVWKPEQRCEVIMLRTPAPYMQLTDRIAEDTGQPKGWADYAKRRTSFYTVMPPASVQHMGGRKAPDLVFTAVHHVGHIALNGMYPNYTYLPVWLDEGFAAWIEHATLSESLTACSTTGYGMVAARQDKWSASAQWKANLKAGFADGSVVPLERLMVMKLNELTWKEIAKSWSVIDRWISSDPAKFLEFVREVRQRYPRYDKHAECSPSDLRNFQIAALQQTYGLDAVGVEKAWRAHVSASY